MALLKDSLVQGSLRVTDELYSDVAYLKTIYAGTSSSDSTPSNGDSGQVLKSDGTNVYWAADNNTDTKVTSVDNHYTPTTNTSSALSVDASSTTAATWNSTSLVTGVNLSRDAKGHVTGLTVDSIRMPANPNTNTDTLVKQTAKSDNVNYKLLMGANSNPTSGTAYEAVYDTNITVNPSTDTITATNFAGNASTATAFSSNATVTLTGDTTGTSNGSTKSWNVPTTTTKLTYLGRKTSVDDIAVNPSTDTGYKVTWHLSDSNSRANDNDSSPSVNSAIINFPWDWGAENGQIAISNTQTTPRMQIRSATHIDNGESANPRYTPNYGDWREVVTATKATQIGSKTQPVYISNIGQATAISYTIAKSVPADAQFTDTTYTPASSVTAIATTAVVGTSTNYARQDHVHNITLATGDNNGQIKIAGTNVSVKGLGSNAYTSTAYLPLADALWNTHGTLIPDNTDLNSYNQTDNGLGNYYSPDSSTSSSLDNSPTANSGFRLISLRGYQNTRGYQIALGTSVTPWVRTETGTARNYTDWAKILYKTGSSAIGGNSQPVYIDSNGKAVAITSVNVAHGGTGATTAADARTNLLAATGNGRIFYGTCTTAGGTAAKVVTCESYDALTVGDVIVVDFSNANSAAVANLTLNVNNKGAKNIKKHYNSTAANNLNAVGVLTNSIHTFVYDGSYWILIDSDYNSSYSVMSVAEMTTGTATSSRVMTAKNLNDFLDSYGLNASNITSGTLAIARGGTNKTSWDINKLVYASATNVLGQLGHASSTSYLLKSGSSSTAPSWIQYTNANTASTIVQRDSSGNFSAGTITATLSGNATTATTASCLNSSTGTTLVGLAGFDISNTTSVYRSQYFQISGTSFYGSSTADVSSTTNNAETKFYLSASSGTISTRGDIQGITSGSLATGTKGWSISNTGIIQCSSISSTGQIQGQNLIAIKRDSNANGGVIQLNPPGSTSTVYIDYWIDETDSNHPYLRFIYGTTLVARIDLAKTTTITLN